MGANPHAVDLWGGGYYTQLFNCSAHGTIGFSSGINCWVQYDFNRFHLVYSFSKLVPGVLPCWCAGTAPMYALHFSYSDNVCPEVIVQFRCSIAVLVQ